MVDSRRNRFYATYDKFIVGCERTKYTLSSVGHYSGNAGQ